MADILHDFFIKASAKDVFDGVSSPDGLDSWWTKGSAGSPILDSMYTLDFGPGYIWEAKVTQCVPEKAFELLLTKAEADWEGTTVGFRMEEKASNCKVQFYHKGWKEESDHYRTSSYCWAMYLRILKRKIEHGEDVPYEQRLSV